MGLLRSIPLRNFSSAVNNNYFVTTPIYYVNATPHIGHLYSSVIADAAQRWRKILHPGIKIRFATGTDEHGSKIQQAAQKNSTSLNQYCNDISNKYKELSSNFSIDCTNFVRTTDENHKIAVQHFWRQIRDRGHVYSKLYGGWYCVSDETFLVDSQLKEVVGKDGKKELVSLESGHPVEWSEEQNYMFRLSSFHDDLRYWLTKNEDTVKPRKFQKILLDMLSEEGLPDVSISRPTSRVHWGIEVPDDPSQTVYVWLDALVNYLTVTGYPSKNNIDWPPDLQVIGKDILKFHGIYWPAFLMAAGLEPPRSILCHSHWTVDGEKMSKSKNNVVCPMQRSEIYTTDGLRYFLLREGVAHSDGNYSDTKVVRILNSEIADTLGNLLSRCTGSALNPNQKFPAAERAALNAISALDVTKRLMESMENLPDICHKHYEEHNFYKVADAVIASLHQANLFFETMKPWELKKNTERHSDLDAVLHITLETLRIASTLLQPMIPNLSKKMLDKINVPISRRNFEDTKIVSWKKPEDFVPVPISAEKLILFQRIITSSETKPKKEEAPKQPKQKTKKVKAKSG